MLYNTALKKTRFLPTNINHFLDYILGAGRRLIVTEKIIIKSSRRRWSSGQRIWLGNERFVSSSTPTSAIIYDAYISIIKKKLKFGIHNSLLS